MYEYDQKCKISDLPKHSQIDNFTLQLTGTNENHVVGFQKPGSRLQQTSYLLEARSFKDECDVKH